MASRSMKQMRYLPQTTSSPKVAPAKPALNAMPRMIAKPPTDARDVNGNRLGARRQVGEADPATRRAALDAALQPGPPVAPVAPKPAPREEYEGGGMGNKARRKVIDQTVDRLSR